MLDVRRCIEVQDGSFIYIDPSLSLSWTENAVLFTEGMRLRPIRHDQFHRISNATANTLINEGLAYPVGGRLFEQPELMRDVFSWENSGEVNFLMNEFSDFKKEGVGLDYGCGVGRVMLPLIGSGLAVDGIDASEPCILWLKNHIADIGIVDHVPNLFVGDICDFAFPGGYDFSFSALNTLRYIPGIPSLRRHFHMVALSVKPEGRYAFHVSTWSDELPPSADSCQIQWSTKNPTGANFDVTWTKVKSDISDRIDLERVDIFKDGAKIITEHQTQISLSISDWISIACHLGEWSLEGMYVDTTPAPKEVKESSKNISGNVWFVLRRTNNTNKSMFTR